MKKIPSFIIYAPRYRDESGGAIVLHKLCDVLNRNGYTAKLWPLWKPCLSTHMTRKSIPSALAYFASRIRRGRYTTNSLYLTPMAKKADIAGSIVVYPEIVSGNPLHAERYVRWFLHKPGFHEGKFEYKDHDLCFSYQDAFNNINQPITYGGTLTISETFLHTYKFSNARERSKICHMVRKGRDRPDLPNLKDCWVVDGRTHQELAKIFNECRICYFYDLYTAYSVYAAVCGCIPVIVPIKGVTKQDWMPKEQNRFGLAYGDDDILHAIATRELLLRELRETDQRNTRSVNEFVLAVRERFNLHEINAEQE